MWFLPLFLPGLLICDPRTIQNVMNCSEVQPLGNHSLVVWQCEGFYSYLCRSEVVYSH